MTPEDIIALLRRLNLNYAEDYEELTRMLSTTPPLHLAQAVMQLLEEQLADTEQASR